jgi:predicted Na+-dependent transporter
VPLISTVMQLGSTVLLPLLFGQFARRVAGNWPQQKAHVLGFFSQFALLLVIYSTFCDTFANDAGHMDASDVLFAFLFGMEMFYLGGMIFTKQLFFSYYSSSELDDSCIFRDKQVTSMVFSFGRGGNFILLDS